MLKAFGCSDETDALKAQARGLEDVSIAKDEKIVTLTNELEDARLELGKMAALKQKYIQAKVTADKWLQEKGTMVDAHTELENALALQKVTEEKRADEFTALLRAEVARSTRLAAEKAELESAARQDASRLAGSVGDLELKQRVDASQLAAVMDELAGARARLAATDAETKRLREELRAGEEAQEEAAARARAAQEENDARVTAMDAQLRAYAMQAADLTRAVAEMAPLRVKIASLEAALDTARVQVKRQSSQFPSSPEPCPHACPPAALVRTQRPRWRAPPRRWRRPRRTSPRRVLR